MGLDKLVSQRVELAHRVLERGRRGREVGPVTGDRLECGGLAAGGRPSGQGARGSGGHGAGEGCLGSSGEHGGEAEGGGGRHARGGGAERAPQALQGRGEGSTERVDIAAGGQGLACAAEGLEQSEERAEHAEHDQQSDEIGGEPGRGLRLCSGEPSAQQGCQLGAVPFERRGALRRALRQLVLEPVRPGRAQQQLADAGGEPNADQQDEGEREQIDRSVERGGARHHGDADPPTDEYSDSSHVAAGALPREPAALPSTPSRINCRSTRGSLPPTRAGDRPRAPGGRRPPRVRPGSASRRIRRDDTMARAVPCAESRVARSMPR